MFVHPFAIVCKAQIFALVSPLVPTINQPTLLAGAVAVSAFLKITKTLLSVESSDEIVDTVFTLARSVLVAERVSMFLVDVENKELVAVQSEDAKG